MKKLLLTLGTVAAVAAPVASVIACGSDNGDSAKRATLIADLKKLTQYDKQSITEKTAFDASVAKFSTEELAEHADTLQADMLEVVQQKLLAEVAKSSDDALKARLTKIINADGNPWNLEDWALKSEEFQDLVTQIQIAEANAAAKAADAPIEVEATKSQSALDGLQDYFFGGFKTSGSLLDFTALTGVEESELPAGLVTTPTTGPKIIAVRDVKYDAKTNVLELDLKDGSTTKLKLVSKPGA